VIAVVDYGASQRQSVLRALRAVARKAELTPIRRSCAGAAQVRCPGLGHFAPAMLR